MEILFKYFWFVCAIFTTQTYFKLKKQYSANLTEPELSELNDLAKKHYYF
jgi:hypothetical protein